MIMAISSYELDYRDCIIMWCWFSNHPVCNWISKNVDGRIKFHFRYKFLHNHLLFKKQTIGLYMKMILVLLALRNLWEDKLGTSFIDCCASSNWGVHYSLSPQMIFNDHFDSFLLAIGDPLYFNLPCFYISIFYL